MINWKSKYLKYKLKYLKFKGGMNNPNSHRIKIEDLLVHENNTENLSNTNQFGNTIHFDCLHLLNGIDENIYEFEILYTNLSDLKSIEIDINDYIYIERLFNKYSDIAGKRLCNSYKKNLNLDSNLLTFNKIEPLKSGGECNSFNDLIALSLLKVFDYKVLFAKFINIEEENIEKLLNVLNHGFLIQLHIPFLRTYHYINILKNPDDSSYNLFSINGSDTTLLKTTFNDKDLLAYYLINVYNRDLFKDDKETYFNIYKTLTGINLETFYEKEFEQKYVSESDDEEEFDSEEELFDFEVETENDIIKGMFPQDHLCVILGVEDCADEDI